MFEIKFGKTMTVNNLKNMNILTFNFNFIFFYSANMFRGSRSTYRTPVQLVGRYKTIWDILLKKISITSRNNVAFPRNRG